MDVPTCGESFVPNELLQAAGPPSHPSDSQVVAAVPPLPAQVVCWACSTRIYVPLVGEEQRPAPRFMCGWCGAFIDTFTVQSRPRRLNFFLAVMKALNSLSWGVAAFVAFLISSIILSGVPLLQHIIKNQILLVAAHLVSYALGIYVFFNFAACVFLSAGKVTDYHPHPEKGKPVPQGSYTQFCKCDSCDAPRSPPAVHCRQCKTCVVDLDHHCPFINNCVGRTNLRNFLLFLIWAALSVLYAGWVAAIYLLTQGDVLTEAANDVFTVLMKEPPLALLVLITKVLRLPWLMLGALWCLNASAAVYFGVTALFIRQLASLSDKTACKRAALAAGHDPERYHTERHCSPFMVVLDPLAKRNAFLGLREALNVDTAFCRGSVFIACLRAHWGPVSGTPALKKSA